MANNFFENFKLKKCEGLGVTILLGLRLVGVNYTSNLKATVCQKWEFIFNFFQMPTLGNDQKCPRNINKKKGWPKDIQ